MSIDHNGDTYYLLNIVSGDADGIEQSTVYAIPPGATDGFIRVVRGMDPKRE